MNKNLINFKFPKIFFLFCLIFFANNLSFAATTNPKQEVSSKSQANSKQVSSKQKSNSKKQAETKKKTEVKKETDIKKEADKEEEANSKKEGRAIISSLKNEIIPRISYSSQELQYLNPNFAPYYFQKIKPRLEDLEKYIDDKAINFVNINGKKALIFYSEGISFSTSGIKDFIAIATKNDDGWKITAFDYLSGISISCAKADQCHFSYSKLRILPKTPNKLLAGVFSYATYEGAESAFYIKIIRFNPYDQRFDISTIVSTVPLISDDNWK